MNSTVKDICLFAFGAAVGTLVTYLSVKEYFERKADMEVESVKEAFEDKLATIEDSKSSIDGELEGPEEIDDGVPKSSSIISKNLNNKPPLTDYTAYFKEKGMEELKLKETIRDAKEDALAESEHPEDDEPYTDEEDEEQTLIYEDQMLNGEHKKALEEDRAPYIIELSDYELTCASYEKAALLYYVLDDILCEESGEIVSRFDVVGDCLRTSGFSDNDEERLFVRNDKLMCDYDINKVYTPYEN
jgi:hypothetical protein